MTHVLQQVQMLGRRQCGVVYVALSVTDDHKPWLYYGGHGTT